MTEVFLGREALGAGMSRHELRRWYHPIFRGVYVPNGSTPTLADRTLGAWLTSDRTGVIAGAAASAVHGAKWVDHTEPIEILLGERRRQSGLIVRTDRISVDEVEDLDGLTVTTPARTAFDLGRYQKRYTAIGRLDALLRAAPYSADEVMVLMQRYGPVRGIRQLRELLPLVDPGAESPMESRWRLIFIDNGFPIPETQVPVLDDAGEPFAYLDMGWRDIQMAVEYDGEQHRTDSSVSQRPAAAAGGRAARLERHPYLRGGHHARRPWPYLRDVVAPRWRRDRPNGVGFSHFRTRTYVWAGSGGGLTLQAQSGCGALRYRLAHPIAVGHGPFRLQDRHAAVVLDLEHLLGDRLADAVAGALAEVDFYPHDVSDRHLGYWIRAGTRLTPWTKVL